MILYLCACGWRLLLVCLCGVLRDCLLLFVWALLQSFVFTGSCLRALVCFRYHDTCGIAPPSPFPCGHGSAVVCGIFSVSAILLPRCQEGATMGIWRRTTTLGAYSFPVSRPGHWRHRHPNRWGRSNVGLAAIFSSAGSSDTGCVEVFESQTSLPTATHEVERTNKTPHIGAKFPVSSAAATLNGFLSRSNGQCNTACTLRVGLFPDDDGREQSDDTLSY